MTRELPTPDKPTLRDQVWTAITEGGVARFPGPRGRIPNFKGAEVAAEHLEQSEAWQRARRIKCNPDSPQRPARHRALKADKVLYLAVPKLAADEPFLELDPSVIPPNKLWETSSIVGASRWGVPRRPDTLPPLDLVLTGCVAVTGQGARLGKGGGYSDLEYAVLRELGAVTEETPVLTTVHPLQVLDGGLIPMAPHDLSIDGFATPDGFVSCDRAYRRPAGIDPSILDDERRLAIPILRDRR